MNTLIYAAIFLGAAGAITTVVSQNQLSLLRAALVFPAIVGSLIASVLGWIAVATRQLDGSLFAMIGTFGALAAAYTLAIGLMAGALWLRYQRRP